MDIWEIAATSRSEIRSSVEGSLMNRLANSQNKKIGSTMENKSKKFNWKLENDRTLKEYVGTVKRFRKIEIPVFVIDLLSYLH